MEDEKERSSPDRFASLITTVASVLGILVSVAALNVERSWRTLALVLGVAGILVSLAALRVARRRRLVTAAGLALLVAAGAVLALSPTTAKPARPAPQARLKLSQMVLAGGADGKPVTLDVTVHNTGLRRSLLTGLDLTVRHFSYLPTCQMEGEVVHGPAYPVTMPDRPSPGAVVTATLHEQVGADQVDRLLVRIGAPPYRRDKLTHLARGAVFAYQVDLSITSDGQRPLRVGKAVFTVPFLPSSDGEVWNVDDPSRVAEFAQSRGYAAAALPADEKHVTSCLDANSRALKALLELRGHQLAGLSGAFTGP